MENVQKSGLEKSSKINYFMQEIKITTMTIPEERIMNKIYIIRGQKVMLDRDLAELYQIPTKRLNEQVQRNIKRFPSTFVFQMNEDEMNNWKSQFATSNKIKMGLRKKPYVFTEHGILMLSSVLNTDIAINTSILIIEVFVRLKEILSQNAELRAEIQRVEDKFDKKVGAITEVVKRLVERDEDSDGNKIGFGWEGN